jgi:choline dehydrogenase
MNIVDGRRQSAADAYLRPVMHRGNLDVIGGATAHRVQVENDRCRVVDVTQDGVTYSVVVEREAVICSGTKATFGFTGTN